MAKRQRTGRKRGAGGRFVKSKRRTRRRPGRRRALLLGTRP